MNKDEVCTLWSKGRDQLNYDTDIEKCARIISDKSQPSQKRASAYFERGRTQHAKGVVAHLFSGNGNSDEKLGAAIQDFTEALRLNPNWPEALDYRCLAFIMLDQIDEALADRSEIIRLEPGRGWPFRLRGDLYLHHKNDYQHAIADYSEAVRLDPQDAEAYESRAEAYSRKGEYNNAVADYGEVLRVKPDEAELYRKRGEVLRLMDKYDEAIAAYAEFIRLKQGDPGALEMRGNAFRLMRMHDQAIADYDRAIQLAPHDTEAFIGRAIAHADNGDYGRAINDCTEAIRLDPEAALAYNNRAWFYLKNGAPEKGLLDADKARGLNPKNPLFLGTRGHIFLTLGKIDAALSDFNRAIEQGANSGSTYWGRGRAYEQKGSLNSALADYRKVLEFEANEPDEREARAKAEVGVARLYALPAARVPADVGVIRRIALVIGNAGYANAPPLNNPLEDAKAMAAALRRVGFSEVVELLDVGLEQIRDELKVFGDKAASADWALVYFAGHGMQFRGQTYLIPTDAKLMRAAHAADEAVPLDRVLDKLKDARQLRLVILDACRDNPFIARLNIADATRSTERGLARVESTAGALIVYAARDGQIANDGTGEHSPFTEALLEHLEKPGLEMGLLFRKVRDTVLKRTDGAQEPYTYGSLPSEGLYFKAAEK